MFNIVVYLVERMRGEAKGQGVAEEGEEGEEEGGLLRDDGE